MRTQIRILAALLVVWLALIALMTLSPNPGERRHVDVSNHPAAGQYVAGLDDVTFSHTGLWATEVGPDGTTALVRDIRRQ